MTTSTQTTRAAKPAPTPRNGVDTPRLFATIDAVAGQPQLAKFEFRAKTVWLTGAHCRTNIDGFFGAGSEHSHKRASTHDADHPAVLVGEDNSPTPMEFVLHALGSCLVAGVASVAAARRIDLYEVVAHVEGKVDLRGALGLSDEVRNGYESIRVSFEIRGDAPAETLQQIIEQSKKRSAVFDIVSKGVPVEIAIHPN